MICPKCGREIPDGTVCPCSYGTPALSSNPAVHVLKSVGSSTIFLVMAILSTAAVVFSILANLSAANGVIPAYLDQIYNYIGVDPSVYESVMSSAAVSSSVSIVVGGLISGLTTVALWVHYFTCRNRNSGNISTVGLTIWKVFTWIGIVSLIIACVGVVILMAIMMIGAAAGGDDVGIYIGVAVFLTIFLGVILGLGLACEIATLRVINRAKTVAYNGIPDNRVSQFLVVMIWIGGIFTTLSGLVGLFGAPLTGIAGLASGVSSILSAICLTRYRQEMTAVMYPPVQPVYAQQPAAPVAPQQPVTPVPPVAPQPPVEPAAPVTPAAPVEPAAPQQTAEPTDSTESNKEE